MTVTTEAMLAKALTSMIDGSKTRTARGTITASSSTGTCSFTVGGVTTARNGIWVGKQPQIGDQIVYIDEGRGMPLVLGSPGSAAWASYTPTWTSSGSAPAIGDGTLLGRYRRDGTTLSIQSEIIVGSTTTVGSGQIRLSLPSGITAASAMQQVGSAWWWDASTGILSRGVAVLDASATYFYPWLADGTSGGDSSGLANGDNIHFGGVFEIAP